MDLRPRRAVQRCGHGAGVSSAKMDTEVVRNPKASKSRGLETNSGCSFSARGLRKDLNRLRGGVLMDDARAAIIEGLNVFRALEAWGAALYACWAADEPDPRLRAGHLIIAEREAN